jgi:hypothetical protein
VSDERAVGECVGGCVDLMFSVQERFFGEFVIGRPFGSVLAPTTEPLLHKHRAPTIDSHVTSHKSEGIGHIASKPHQSQSAWPRALGEQVGGKVGACTLSKGMHVGLECAMHLLFMSRVEW